MKRFTRILLKGFATVIPLFVTVALMYWLVVSVEAALKTVILTFFSEANYFSGLGILFIFVTSLIAGLIMEASLLRSIVDYFESKLMSVPVVNTVYGAFRDFFDFLSGEATEEYSKVVLVSVPGSDEKLLGLVTSAHPHHEIHALEETTIAVYFPMSYQLGGYTLFVDKANVLEVDMPIQEALRFILTAGVSRARNYSDPQK